MPRPPVQSQAPSLTQCLAQCLAQCRGQYAGQIPGSPGRCFADIGHVFGAAKHPQAPHARQNESPNPRIFRLALALPCRYTPRHSRPKARRGGGVVDRAGLENRSGCKPTVGSNPTLSATCPLTTILRRCDQSNLVVIFGSYPPVSGKLSAALLFSIFQVGGIGR